MIFSLGSTLIDFEPALALPSAVDIVCKSVVLLLIAWLVTFCLRRAAAAIRHMVWSVAVVCTLLVALISVVIPNYNLPVIPDALAAFAFPHQPMTQAAEVGQPAAVEHSSDLSDVVVRSSKQIEQPESWAIGLLAVWVAGSIIYLAITLFGMIRLNVIRRAAQPMIETSWIDLVANQSAKLGITRPITIMWAGQTAMPLTFGLVHPVILLPDSAVDWPVDRRYAVIVHELAHVRRFDCVTQFLAYLGVALFWFNPLAHLAARQLRTERERACDDFVLRTGVPAESYADHLLQIAKNLQAPTATAPAAVAMARRSALEGRMLAILESPHSRQPVGIGHLFFAMIVAGAITVGIASVHLAAASPGEVVAHSLVKEVAQPGDGMQEMSGGESGDVEDVAKAERYLLIQILAEGSGEPVANAKLNITIDDHAVTWQADAEGRYQLPRPVSGEIKTLAVTVHADSYVPQTIRYLQTDQPLELVSPLLIYLSQGYPVGGLVQDKKGKAVRNATITLRFDTSVVNEAGQTITIPDQVVQTNNFGWWHCNTTPENLESLMMKITHPIYEGDEDFQPIDEGDRKKLREKIHTRTLERPEGQPDGLA